MESGNPVFVDAEVGMSNAQGYSPENIAAEFKELFEQAAKATKKEESPIMEQAHVLMNKAVFENDADVEIDLGTDTVAIGEKIAKLSTAIMQGRNTAEPLTEEDISQFWC